MGFRSTIARGGAIACAFAVLVSTGSALAQPPRPEASVAEADRHFRRGVELFDRGAFAEALASFKEAYALAPDFRVLFNIGQAQYELKDHASALSTLRRYLAEGGSRVPADRRASVEADLQTLERRVAADAPVAPRVEPVRPAPPPPAPPPARSPLGVVLLASGGVVLVASFVMDVVFVGNAIDDFEALRDRDDPRAGDARATVRTLRTTAIVGYASGAVLTIAGAAITFWPQKSTTSSASLVVRPSFAPGTQGGLVAAGTF